MQSRNQQNVRHVEVTLWTPIKKPLAYLAPVDMSDRELLGRRVVVPVGTRRQIGIITSLTSSYEGKLKSIHQFCDLQPILSADALTLCHFLSEYYFTPLGECIKACLPGPMTAKLRQQVELLSRETLAAKAETGDTTAADLLRRFRRRKLIPARNVTDLKRARLKPLLGKGVIGYRWELRESRAQAQELIVTLNPDGKGGKQFGAKAQALLDWLGEKHTADLQEVRQRFGVSRATITALQRRGLITLNEKPPFRGDPFPTTISVVQLTPEQEKAVAAVNEKLKSGGFAPFLLYGVTGSGKTEVYLRAINQAIKLGKSAIVIVPEIGLSQAIYQNLKASLGEAIGLIHSRLTARSRLSIWQQAREGNLKVVLGPRSAVFSPLQNLGLIIVDEEHDHSLKQDSPAPRYHARDVAIFRARQEGCAAVLGSATPAVESFYNARSGKYQLLCLPRRVDRRTMPRVATINLREAFEKRGYNWLSEELVSAIDTALGQQGQVMLLLNRRGFAPSVHCYSCGNKFGCPHCAVTLVYHKRENRLLCHSCGYREPYPDMCPSCGSNLYLFRGIGTEKLQEELQGYFPDKKIIRMDLDSTRRRGAFDQIYESFRSGKAQILIGTQMIAKGFDFPDVAFVGVVSADTALELPDFRARERTFHLLTQAAGRAGRQTFPGEVLLQTLHPENRIITLAAKHDYESFYQLEIAERQALDFPPFAHLILIRLESAEEDEVVTRANWLAAALRSVSKKPYRILGPTPAPIFKRKSKFRQHILLKTKKVKTTLRYLEKILAHKSLQSRSKLSIIVDVDAVDMM